MNREQKSAVIDQIATDIKESEAVFAVDYRGISVQQAAELRARLNEAGASFRIVKNTLTERAADEAGADSLKELLEGPTAFTFVRGDAALAAKAIATFRRQHDVLEFKGGTMAGETVSVEDLQAIARLPGLDVLHGQLVGVISSPVTGLVRGLGALVSGLTIQLGQIRDQGLVGGAEPAPDETEAKEEPAAETIPEDTPPDEEDVPEEAPAEPEEAPAAEEAPAEEETSEEPSEAPGDPVAEAEAVEEETETENEAPSEGDTEEEG